jgi:hypothetical protein
LIISSSKKKERKRMYAPRTPEEDKLTIKQARLVNALCNPENKGNISAACNMAKISREQYYQWMKNSPAFRNAIDERTRGIADAHLPEVWNSLIESINETRDPKAIKLYMELTGRYQNNVNLTGGSKVVIMSGEDDLAK